jgi:hypothetical protein
MGRDPLEDLDACLDEVVQLVARAVGDAGWNDDAARARALDLATVLLSRYSEELPAAAEASAALERGKAVHAELAALVRARGQARATAFMSTLESRIDELLQSARMLGMRESDVVIVAVDRSWPNVPEAFAESSVLTIHPRESLARMFAESHPLTAEILSRAASWNETYVLCIQGEHVQLATRESRAFAIA